MAYGYSAEPTVYRGDSAPAQGNIGDIWVDTSVSGSPVLKICTSATPTWTEVGGGVKPTKTTEYATAGTGSHTITNGTWVKVTCVGGGGGGGGKGGTSNILAGGGSGAATVVRFYKTTGTSLSYIVGSGGAGGSTAGSNGSDGTATRFDSVVAPGGRGGQGRNLATGYAGVVGGGYNEYANSVTTSTGTYTVTAPVPNAEGITYGGAGGGAGASFDAQYAGFPIPSSGATYGTATASTSGAGGCSVYGLGGDGSVNQTGIAATGYGGGGGGAGSTTTTDYAGGAGSDGYIIVEEFGVW